MLKETVELAESRGVLELVKILLYPDKLLPEHRAELQKIEQGIVWLTKDEEAGTAE